MVYGTTSWRISVVKKKNLTELTNWRKLYIYTVLESSIWLQQWTVDFKVINQILKEYSLNLLLISTSSLTGKATWSLCCSKLSKILDPVKSEYVRTWLELACTLTITCWKVLSPPNLAPSLLLGWWRVSCLRGNWALVGIPSNFTNFLSQTGDRQATV